MLLNFTAVLVWSVTPCSFADGYRLRVC